MKMNMSIITYFIVYLLIINCESKDDNNDLEKDLDSFIYARCSKAAVKSYKTSKLDDDSEETSDEQIQPNKDYSDSDLIKITLKKLMNFENQQDAYNNNMLEILKELKNKNACNSQNQNHIPINQAFDWMKSVNASYSLFNKDVMSYITNVKNHINETNFITNYIQQNYNDGIKKENNDLVVQGVSSSLFQAMTEFKFDLKHIKSDLEKLVDVINKELEVVTKSQSKFYLEIPHFTTRVLNYLSSKSTLTHLSSKSVLNHIVVNHDELGEVKCFFLNPSGTDKKKSSCYIFIHHKLGNLKCKDWEDAQEICNEASGSLISNDGDLKTVFQILKELKPINKEYFNRRYWVGNYLSTDGSAHWISDKSPHMDNVSQCGYVTRFGQPAMVHYLDCDTDIAYTCKLPL